MPARFGRLVGRLGAWGRRSRAHRVALFTGLAFAGGLALAFLAFGTAYAVLDFPREPRQLQTTLVLDADGKPIGDLCKDQDRIVVPLEEIAPVMRDAVIATEDRKFYEHSGIDPVGTVRALLNDVKGGELQGGSTITQQLVKNVRLNADRTLWRKGKEAVLAVKVENQFTKDEILALYLNTVYFGRSAHGIEVAANRYFGKKASELDVSQAAYLAGLIRAPEVADAIAHPQEAAARRAIVLDAMVRKGDIGRDEAEAVKAQPIGAIEQNDRGCQLSGPNAFFLDQVRAWTLDRYGEGLAFGGGLRIQTTLRLPMQQAADKAVREVLNKPDDPDAALVALADDGAIVAMIGGKDFATSKINLAIGKEGGNLGRQAGSTFKPLVLAAAFAADIPVNQRYEAPPKMEVPFQGHKPYPVQNYDAKGFGSIDLYESTAQSVNTAYAQLASETGIDNVARTAEQLGIPVPKEKRVPSLSLGTHEVDPLQMVRAYMTFANRGDRPQPYYVRKVTDAEGDVLYEASPKKEAVYDRAKADLVNRVLQDVVTKGTGRAAAIPRRQVAGKTGTTEDYGDAWFVGYTPKLGAAVWMGHKEGTDNKMDDVRGSIRVTGGGFPAQIWGRFMRAAVQGLDTGSFTAPPKALLEAQPKGTSAPPPPDPEGSTTTTSSTTSTTSPDESATTTSSSSTTSTSSTTTTTSTSSTTSTTSTTQPTTTTTRRGGG